MIIKKLLKNLQRRFHICTSTTENVEKKKQNEAIMPIEDEKECFMTLFSSAILLLTTHAVVKNPFRV